MNEIYLWRFWVEGSGDASCNWRAYASTQVGVVACAAHIDGISAHMSRTSVRTCMQDAVIEGTAMLRDELHEARERAEQLQRAVDDAQFQHNKVGEVINN